MLTPHCSAASGMVAPPSIVPTTRLRRSAEYGFALPAGLLPAGSLNHIRAAMGILDSAFSGNALTFVHVVLSLTGLLSGFVVLYGLLTAKQMESWVPIFFVTTLATSVTGFGFPFHGFTPGLGVGVLSLV